MTVVNIFYSVISLFFINKNKHVSTEIISEQREVKKA